MMRCEKCGRGPAGGTTIYRQNAIGEIPARWRCAECGGRTDDETQHLVNAIEAKLPPDDAHE